MRWRYVALIGGLGLAGFTSLFSLGGQHTTAVNLGITQGAIPAFVIPFGLLLSLRGVLVLTPVVTLPCY